jgi:colicin import membrane protein
MTYRVANLNRRAAQPGTDPFRVSPLLPAMLAAAALSACSTVLLPSNVVPVAPMSHSVEQANHSLAEAARDRANIEAAYAASEEVCSKRFFVNTCLEQAREQRRSALAVVRAVEVEAEHFKRKFSADERDRALAAVAVEDARRVAAAEAAAAAAAAAAPPPEAAPAQQALPKARVTPEQSAAAHAKKMAGIAARDKAGAEQRAERVAAFERKKEASLRRQEAIARKKAAKAEKAAE